VTLADLDASSAVVLAWLLTYAIHSTILLAVAAAIASRFADEQAWLDLVWKTALLGPLVTASLQVGANVIPLGGRWPIEIAAPVTSAPAMPLAPRAETALTPEPTVGLPASQASDRGEQRGEQNAQTVSPATATRAGAGNPVARVWPAVAVLSWLAIGTIGLVRFGARCLRLHRTLGSGSTVSAAHLRQTVEALCGAASGRPPIRLTTSTTCAIPLALAGRQIVLPERFLDELDADEQRAALAHEIAHVVRRDPAWRMLIGALERAFFFQPLNRVARARLCESAEFLCDQWAVKHTSPLALARCLSTVASWASPASDGLAAAASTMARSDSPLVRRVARILKEPAPAARRPSVVWLALPLAVVAIAAPLVTAAQLSDLNARGAPPPLALARRLRAALGPQALLNARGAPPPLALARRLRAALGPQALPADTARISATPGKTTIPPDAGQDKQKQEPSSPRVWTATELAQARARLRVHRSPRPTDPLAERWRWALADAGRQGIGDFWIVYRFDTPTHAQDLMMSDTREGSFVTATGEVKTQGPPLADLLDDTAPVGGGGNVTVLFHYSGARAEAIDRGGYRSTRLGFDFGRAPVFWLGVAPEAESFERVRELFGQARQEKIQVLLIELASLHSTTDVVLPFLTRLVDPSHPVAIRREAAEGFDHHHDPRSVEILLRVARTDPVSEVRSEAAETIGEVQTPQSIPALTDLATNSADPAVRREAAEAFADQPPELALPAIERLIATTTDEEVLVEAIEALGEIPGEINAARVTAMLVRTANGHPSQRAQQEAVETLGEIEAPGALAALTRIVWEHKDVTIQREAVETLGDRHEAAAVAELERILREHPVEEVQAEAIETLTDKSDHRLNPLILELALSGTSPRLRREALDAIAHAASGTSDVATLDKLQQTIERAIFNDPDRSVRMEALDALDQLPRERALRVLRSVLERHTDAKVRDEAKERR
jgi:HEAT repeat protein/beta-lactamase regulating signal transducer with metallopeptidase domain